MWLSNYNKNGGQWESLDGGGISSFSKWWLIDGFHKANDWDFENVGVGPTCTIVSKKKKPSFSWLASYNASLWKYVLISN